MSAAPDACVMCGEPEPFGLSVCARCGGAGGDTLVFVRPSEASSDRRRMSDLVRSLLEGRAHVAELGLVASGHRALIRVPANAAATVVRRLAVRGIPARTRPDRWVWATAPYSFYFLLATTVVVGGWAGLAAESLLLWTTPLVALVLLLAAQLRLRQPVIETPSRQLVFPGHVTAQIAHTFAKLPIGTPRDLLAQLIRAAEPVYRALGDSPAAVTREEVEQLVSHSCQAALDLSDLETALAALAGEAGTERAQRLRDRMLARFRQGIHVLHRLRAETVETHAAREEFAELLVVLDEETRVYVEALSEVKQLTT